MIRQNISKKILHWYDNNKRTLPWRNKKSKKQSEFCILISEIMLQQTQVNTVIPYFERFIKNVPSLDVLANIKEKKLLKLWEGLGYYSRAKNLQKTARLILQNFNGKMPNSFEDLKSLPGIGDYTASAIMAIAHNKPYIPLDGNIERVIKRFLYLKKEYEIKKNKIIKKKNIFGISKRSSDYAQALMELGALICKPSSPLCIQCPISNGCKSFKKKDFAVTKIKKKKIEKYYVLKVYKRQNRYLLIKNTKFNFLKNLRIFPMQELSKPKNFKENLNMKMSNMNMNIQIKYHNFKDKIPSSICWYFRFIYCKFI